MRPPLFKCKHAKLKLKNKLPINTPGGGSCLQGNCKFSCEVGRQQHSGVRWPMALQRKSSCVARNYRDFKYTARNKIGTVSRLSIGGQMQFALKQGPEKGRSCSLVLLLIQGMLKKGVNLGCSVHHLKHGKG